MMYIPTSQTKLTSIAAFFHSLPRIVLYNLAEKYPAISPEKTKRKIAHVPRAPLLAGESIPNIAKTENVKYLIL